MVLTRVLDEKLSLRWYDAQGCIESIGFDFVKRLPLFVVMVMIFQRFSPCALGLSQPDASHVTVDNLTFDIEEDRPLFQLFGRHTFGSAVSLRPTGAACSCDENVSKSRTCRQTRLECLHPGLLLPIPEECTPTSPELQITECEDEGSSARVSLGKVTPAHASALDAGVKEGNTDVSAGALNEVQPPPDTKVWFFKSSWKENSRDRECDIIETAHTRAEKYLKDFSRMVTNHIPKMKVKETCALSSTSRVRIFMKDVGGNKDLSKDYIKQHGRTRIWMVSRKLKPITKLRADDFWKVFWDIVRCMFSHFYSS